MSYLLHNHCKTQVLPEVGAVAREGEVFMLSPHLSLCQLLHNFLSC